MREPPTFVREAEVLAMVADGWLADVDTVEHLPVGFGAHHWMARQAGTPRLFVTLDRLGYRHTAHSLEAAYAGAAALASGGLEFVVAPVAHRSGHFTAPLAGHAVSCTPWRDGVVAGTGPITAAELARANAAALTRLHAARLDRPIPTWRPRVGPNLADTLASRAQTSWSAGPYGEPARAAIRRHLGAIRDWTTTYHQLAEQARSRPWVPTHGEPHTANQLITTVPGKGDDPLEPPQMTQVSGKGDDPLEPPQERQGTVFVDWETLAIAPRERDLRPLVDSGHADLVAPDWTMIEMFDLEWRLDEVSQYAAWFASPHTASEDDRIAFAALLGELDRN